jgi:hypothetical protein
MDLLLDLLELARMLPLYLYTNTLTGKRGDAAYYGTGYATTSAIDAETPAIGGGAGGSP